MRHCNFEGIGPCFYERVAFRAPRAGEYYLSGAIVEAYRAPNDLISRYHVVKPTHHAIPNLVWVRGKKLED